MPSFGITIQGKTYRVEIPDPGATPLQVVVDGQAFAVTIGGDVTLGDPELTAIPSATLAEAPRPAAQPVPLPPLPRISVARPATPAAAPAGAHDITAPMPGTILSVDVKAGQTVETGQVVCVLEAMKMKNPIRANAPGTVTEVLAQAGQTVAYGEVLIRLA